MINDYIKKKLSIYSPVVDSPFITLRIQRDCYDPSPSALLYLSLQVMPYISSTL